MQTTNRWPALVLKYWRGTISKPEEAELYRQRSASTMKDEQFRRVTSLRWLLSSLRERHNFNREESWKSVVARVKGQAPETVMLPQRRRKINWVIVGIAASVVGAIAAGIVVYFLASKSSPPIADTDVLPFPNRARLIWQGDTIQLDDKENGILFQSPNVQVRKSSDTILITGDVFRSNSQEMNELILPEGSPYKLRLADGTLITMDARSKVKFPTHFEPFIRRVAIEGLGLVEVAKNEKGPFEVCLPTQQIVKALGTTFMVNSYLGHKQSSVSLIEGAVAIRKTADAKKSVLLTPLYQYISEGMKDTVVYNSNMEAEVKALRDDQFNLEKDLRSALDDISEWYEVTVVYPRNLKNPVLKGFAERQQPLSQLLKEIQRSTRFAKLKIKLVNRTIMVSEIP